MSGDLLVRLKNQYIDCGATLHWLFRAGDGVHVFQPLSCTG